MDWTTTSTILAELRDSANQSAWDRFAARFREPIVQFARRMGLSPDDAEEAAQDTLLAFAESFRQGRYDRNKGRLSAWLFGIAFRQVPGQRRTVARRARLARQEASTFWSDAAQTDDASQVWEDEWRRAVIEEGLRVVRQEVEPLTMRAFEAVVRDGRTPADAAEQLGISVRAVYNAKHTVLKRFRALRDQLENL